MSTKLKYKCKYLISSPCRISRRFDNGFIRIQEAYDRRKLYFDYQDTPIAQNFYAIEVVIEEEKKDEFFINTYDKLSRVYCVLFSVYFGKLFYDHGLIESKGMHFVPNVETSRNIYYKLAPFNSLARADACNSLEWQSLSKIEDFFSNEFVIGVIKRINIFLVAARHYWLSLSQIISEPDIAYINLVTTAEILSSNLEFDDSDLFDDETIKMFEEIEQKLDNGDAKSKKIKNRFFQIKRKYWLTIQYLIDDAFFLYSPSKGKKISKENLEKLVKNAYDLRSSYLHSGEEFGRYTVVRPDLSDEYGNPISDGLSKDLIRRLKQSPSYIGMEKIIHYCLFNFLMSHIVSKTI